LPAGPSVPRGDALCDHRVTREEPVMNEPSAQIPPRRLRFGIIGVGIIGQGYAKRLTAEDSPADLVAVADQNPEAAQRIAAEHGVEAAADVADLLARADLDAVIIAVPSGLHAEVTI